MTEELQRQRLVYFFLGKGPSGAFEGYPHVAVVLAEGLRELGWAIASDSRAWQNVPGGEYLFPGGDSQTIELADLIVFSEDYFLYQRSDRLPKLPTRARAPKVYLDRADLSRTVRFIYGRSLRKLDLILKCHATSYFNYPGNVRPTVFGISNRISQACGGTTAAVKQKTAIWNFNHKQFPHSVRRLAEVTVRPVVGSYFEISSQLDRESDLDSSYDRLMFKQTDGRHFDSYYGRLRSATLASCFGGWFLLPVRQREAGSFCMWTRKFLSRLSVTTSLIAQWDSWRLWEAFAAGAAVLHVDFEGHGFLTGGPMPKPMEHYIPVDLKNPYKSLHTILDRPDELIKIGQAGRKWAIQNYSSKPIAFRLLKNLGLADECRNSSQISVPK